MSILNIIEQKQKRNNKKTISYTVLNINESQQRVIESIENNNLITVTGAAGTGKSQTIVNLASHFLTTSRKVLIVSKMDKAVDVVADRLNDLGAECLAMRAGSKLKNSELALKLLDIVEGKINLDNDKFLMIEKLSYIIKKLLKKDADAKSILKAQRVEAIRELLNDTDKRKELILQSKIAIEKKINKKEKLLDRDFSAVLEAFPCWCVTTQQLSGVLPLQENMFDLVIIDEASQCDIASCLPALYRAKKCVCVGDPKQLRHLSWLEKSKEQSFMTKNNVPAELQLIWSYRVNSVFDFLNFYAEESILLNEYYRGYANLFDFANNEFYNGQIKLMKEAKSDCLVKKNVNGSIVDGVNKKEAQEIINEIKRIIAECEKNNEVKTIGVLSPIRKQCDYITKELINSVSYDLLVKYEIVIGTSHALQGSEKDIILLSWVYADNSPYQTLTFINKPELFNVAITRAKEKLINYYSTENLGDTLIQKYLTSIK